MLRNVLSESEMDRLKELAGPKVCIGWFLLRQSCLVVDMYSCIYILQQVA